MEIRWRARIANGCLDGTPGGASVVPPPARRDARCTLQILPTARQGTPRAVRKLTRLGQTTVVGLLCVKT